MLLPSLHRCLPSALGTHTAVGWPLAATTPQANEDDITVEQFSGAMTNMVYRCGLMGSGGGEVQVCHGHYGQYVGHIEMRIT